jgi:hypothetical protein
MTRIIGTRLFSLLLTFLLVSMTFMPAVSAQADGNTIASRYSGNVVYTDSPRLNIIENTRTSSIVEVGDVRITMVSNPEHTSAVMTIRNLTTNEQHRMDYKTAVKSGKYVTEVTDNGKAAGTYTTDYDPFEPGVTKALLEKSSSDSVSSESQAKAMQSYYYWDGVYFTSGSGIKYAHPDYDAYGASEWEGFYISGTQLYHRHMNKYDSQATAQLAPAVAGAAIGAYVGGTVGAVAGTVLGLYLGASTSQALLDERDCIWFYDAKSWGMVVIPVPPFVSNLPKYFRISQYTLWNSLGISNP